MNMEFHTAFEWFIYMYADVYLHNLDGGDLTKTKLKNYMYLQNTTPEVYI